jgi:hypothetical protein
MTLAMIRLWLRRPVLTARLWVAMCRAKRIAIANSRALGLCFEQSPRGYLCNVDGPHREHVALTSDGREVDRWIARADMPGRVR